MKKKELVSDKIGLEKHKDVKEVPRRERKKLLALPFFLSVTLYDIWIVEGLFGRLQIWEYIYIYHQATYYFLIPVLILLISLALRSWRFSVYSTVGIYCGWLDIFYFLLQGKTLPSVYTWWPFWRPFSPTCFQLITFATITLVIARLVDVRLIGFRARAFKQINGKEKELESFDLKG